MENIPELNSEQTHALVEGVVSKLLPRQIDQHTTGYERAIHKVSEFIATTGLPYEPSEDIKKDLPGFINRALTRWALEKAKGEYTGYSSPMTHVMDVPPWAIIANQLNVPFEFDPRLFPLFDLEFFHWDYKNTSAFFHGEFPPLDLVHASRLFGFEENLKQKQENNPYDARCKERPTKKATREDIEKYMEEDSLKDVALAIVDGKGKGMDMSFLAPDGTILYLRDEPGPPRRLLSFEDIQKSLGSDLEKVVDHYATIGRFEWAENILCRRNRVKDFLGSDVQIPQALADHHKEFFLKFDPNQIREKISRMVNSYNPHSMSYGLDIPENFTLGEYCFFRYMTTFIDLCRKSSFLYDTDEKRKLFGDIDMDKSPLELIKMGHQHALSYGDRER